MREIKFRALSMHSRQWVYGVPILTEKPKTTFVMVNEYDKNVCFTKTLGEYTGLKDRNSKEIFERDIVRFQFLGKSVNIEIVFSNGMFGSQEPEVFIPLDDFEARHYEIIGNIYENPELLK